MGVGFGVAFTALVAGEALDAPAARANEGRLSAKRAVAASAQRTDVRDNENLLEKSVMILAQGVLE